MRLNDAHNLQLDWDLFSSSDSWVIILWNRIFKSKGTIKYHIFSIIWTRVKSEFSNIISNTSLIIGSDKDLRFWLDNWCGQPLINYSSLEFLAYKDIIPNNKVSDFIFYSNWNFPQDWQLWFPFLYNLLPCVYDSNSNNANILTWIHKENGIPTLKDAYLFNAPNITVSSWATEVWCAYIPPRKSLLVWKILHCHIFTYNLVISRGIFMASRC